MKKKIAEIVELLMKAKEAYYNDVPIMSDEEFDRMEDELRDLDPENSYFSIVGTQVTSRVKVRHEIPMLSCDKAKNIEGALQWLQKLGLEDESIVIEPKIDGLSCSLLYEKGKLVRIATRGDGYIGQNITHIVNFVKSIPKKITYQELGTKEVRGELYLPKKTNLSNPDEKPLRSLAVGLINRKDSNLEDLGFLHFVSYQLLGTDFQYEDEKLDVLYSNKFEVIDFVVIPTKNTLEEYYNKYLNELREKWSYETDGLVLVVRDTKKWSDLDSKYVVRHHHFYNIAFKAPSLSKETILENIEWNVSRFGNVIPVAIVKAVIIGGTSITRSSLNNVEYVEELGLRVGDRVVIERANDVIPYFKENLSKTERSRSKGSLKWENEEELLSFLGPDNFLIPEKCPSCKGVLEKVGVHLVCLSKECPEKLIRQILHWVQKCEMDGLSESFVRKLVESKRISSIKDLYLLREKDFEGIDGFGLKKTKNALEQIETSTKMSLRQFVVRLGIPMVGERAMEKLGINNIYELFSYKSNDYVISHALEDFIRCNKVMIEDLLEVIDVSPETPKKQGVLRICMTGTGPKSRKELIAKIERAGNTFVDHVSKETDILVCEDVNGSSSKLSKAAKLGVKLVNYQDFF